jgi:hypothetical protein
METVYASDLVTENYIRYGAYVNNGRSTVGMDGLKNVERRVLLGVRDVASTKFQRSSLVVGHTLGNYHPHGDCYPTLTKLVRDGFVLGYGNFGDHLSEAAAMRYTSVKANESFNTAVFRFIDFVPVQDSEFGVREPQRLPVPIPLALLTGNLGIGVGLMMSIPAFSPCSLWAAMKKDDPSLLKPPFGLNIVNSTLQDVWTKGMGFVQYGMRVYQERSELDENRLVSVIEGSPKIFVPDVNRVFQKELEDELVYVRDESVNNVRLVISRVKGMRRISDDDVHKLAQKVATKMCYVRIYVSDGEKAIRIGLRDWLQRCWEMYCESFSAYQKDKIEKLQHRIHIFELIPKVYPLLISNKGTREIASTLSEKMETIREIESKPLRLLRKKDFDAETRKLESEVGSIKTMTAEKVGEEFITAISGV